MLNNKLKKKTYREEITKDDLIDFLAHTEGMTPHKAGVMVSRIIEFLVIQIGSLNKIKISGLGSLSPSYVKARRTYIPKGNEKRWIPAKVKLVLKLEPPIRELLDNQASRYRKIFKIKDENAELVGEIITTDEEEDEDKVNE